MATATCEWVTVEINKQQPTDWQIFQLLCLWWCCESITTMWLCTWRHARSRRYATRWRPRKSTVRVRPIRLVMEWRFVPMTSWGNFKNCRNFAVSTNLYRFDALLLVLQSTRCPWILRGIITTSTLYCLWWYENPTCYYFEPSLWPVGISFTFFIKWKRGIYSRWNKSSNPIFFIYILHTRIHFNQTSEG